MMDTAAELPATFGNDAWRLLLWRYPEWSKQDPDFLRPRPLGEEVVLDSPKVDGEEVVLFGQGDHCPALPVLASSESTHLRAGFDLKKLEEVYENAHPSG